MRINVLIIRRKTMAFDNNQEKISNLLKVSDTSKSDTKQVPDFEFEKKKNFNFTLQPSVREKINNIARKQGYRSASSFLNDYFKNFEE